MTPRQIKCSLLLISCIYCSLQASHNNILAPNVELSLTPTSISDGDYGAFSLFSELGAKNLRGGATYGICFSNYQRFKLSGEYLAQKLHYGFHPGHASKWVSQYALGGAYQYLLPESAFKTIDFGASYSHAFRRHISKTRSIAGSDAAASYLGSTVELWKCAYLAAAANYDYVKYHRHFRSPELANGWGGSASLTQQLPKNLTLVLTSELRKPFYFYEANLSWNRQFDNWGVTCGLYGNYTDGKHGLPNVTAAGIQLGFSFGGSSRQCCRPYATDDSSWSGDCYSRTFCDLGNWVSTPAVSLPVVLAIADPSTAACTAATTSSPIPTQFASAIGGVVDIQTAPFFQSSSPLTFSATGLPGPTSINPSTGEITGTTGRSAVITVTATSVCGSSSQTFNLVLPN